MLLTIVVPVFNEERTIGKVLRSLLDLKIKGWRKQIVVVDDGSSDQSAKVIKKFPVELVSMPINMGKGAAVRLGAKHMKGERMIIQDADLECDPNDIAKLLEKMDKEKLDVVYGTRFKSQNKVRWQTVVANTVITWVANIIYGTRLSDVETVYKLMSKKVVDVVFKKLRCVEFDFEAEVTARIAKLGYKMSEAPIHYSPRTLADGKKMTFAWRHGIAAIYTLIWVKLF